MSRLPPPQDLPGQQRTLDHIIQFLNSDTGYNPDDYETVGENLGVGSTCQVKRVRDLRTGSNFARKIMKINTSSSQKSFGIEAYILWLVEHKHVVNYHTHGFVGGDEAHILLEWCPGGTLIDILNERTVPQLPIHQVQGYTKQILLGLARLHEMEIIHRDLKPENILVMKEKDLETGVPLIKIADFGVANFMTRDYARMTFCGTPDFLPPEVAEGTEQTLSADIFSVGCIVHELLMGVSPRSDRGWDLEPFMKRYGGNPELSDFVTKCVTRDPDRRPTVAEALAHPFMQRPDANSLRSNALSNSTRSRCIENPSREERLRTAILEFNERLLCCGNVTTELDHQCSTSKLTDWLGGLSVRGYRRDDDQGEREKPRSWRAVRASPTRKGSGKGSGRVSQSRKGTQSSEQEDSYVIASTSRAESESISYVYTEEEEKEPGSIPYEQRSPGIPRPAYYDSRGGNTYFKSGSYKGSKKTHHSGYDRDSRARQVNSPSRTRSLQTPTTRYRDYDRDFYEGRNKAEPLPEISIRNPKVLGEHSSPFNPKVAVPFSDNRRESREVRERQPRGSPANLRKNGDR